MKKIITLFSLLCYVFVLAQDFKINVNNSNCVGDEASIFVETITNPEGATFDYYLKYFNEDYLLQDSNKFTDLLPGTYKVKVTLSNKKEAIYEEEVVVVVPEEIKANVIVSPQTETKGGTISIEATGGKKPYQYKIENSSIDQVSEYNNFKDLDSGVYLITIIDANGCVTEYEKVIEKAEPLNVEVIEFESSDCELCTGTSTIKVTGGIPPYFIDKGITGDKVELTEENLYKFEGYCDEGIEYLISDSSGLNLKKHTGDYAFVEITGEVKVSDNDSIMDVVNIKGGSGEGYKVKIYSESTNETFEPQKLSDISLPKGNYYLQIFDSNNCSSEKIDFQMYSKLTADLINILSTSDCNQECNGVIEVLAQEGAGEYSYELFEETNVDNSGDNTTGMFDGLCAGSYYVVVTDKNNNVYKTEKIIIKKTAPLAVDAKVYQSGATNSGSIEVFVEGGLAPYEYSISSKSGTQESNVFESLAPNRGYTVTVIDSKGCKFKLPEIKISKKQINNKLQLKNNIIVVDETIDVTNTKFQWYKLDEKSTKWQKMKDKNNPNLKPETVGKYKVLMTFIANRAITESASVWSDVLVIFEEVLLSVSEDNLPSFSVYPNPTINELNFPNKLIGESFVIYNVQGRKMKTGKLQNTKLNIENLSSGVYLLKLNTYKVIKFVKK